MRPFDSNGLEKIENENIGGLQRLPSKASCMAERTGCLTPKVICKRALTDAPHTWSIEAERSRIRHSWGERDWMVVLPDAAQAQRGTLSKYRGIQDGAVGSMTQIMPVNKVVH